MCRIMEVEKSNTSLRIFLLLNQSLIFQHERRARVMRFRRRYRLLSCRQAQAYLNFFFSFSHSFYPTVKAFYIAYQLSSPYHSTLEHSSTLLQYLVKAFPFSLIFLPTNSTFNPRPSGYLISGWFQIAQLNQKKFFFSLFFCNQR